LRSPAPPLAALQLAAPLPAMTSRAPASSRHPARPPRPSRTSQIGRATHPLCPECRTVARRLTTAAGLVFLHCEQRREQDVVGAGGTTVRAGAPCNTHAVAQTIPGGLVVTTKITAEERARLQQLLEHLERDAERTGEELRTGELARHVYELLAIVGPIHDAIGPDHAPKVACTSCGRSRPRFYLFDGECRWCRDGVAAPEDVAPATAQPVARAS